MKHLNSPLRYWPLGFLAIAIVMAGIAAVPPPPIQRNVITTNTPSVVTFGGIAQVNDTILGWDTTQNKFVDMFIGANLTYTPGTTTLSATGGGGSQTPWLSDIDADVFSLTNLNNLLFTAGGGRIRGGTNAIFGSNDSTSTNKITSGNGAMIVGSATTSSTNHVTKDGSAIFGVASNSSANVVNGNVAGVIIGSANNSSTNDIFAGDANLIVAVAGLSGGRGTSGGRNRNGGNGSVIIGTADNGALGGSGGQNIIASGNASVLIGYATGSNAVNITSGNGSMLFGTASGIGTTNNNAGNGSLMSGFAIAGGRNSMDSSQGMFFSGRADGGTNSISGNGSKLFGYATSGGLNSASGTPSEVHGIAVSGGKNSASGGSSRVWGHADQATNQVTGIGSLMWAYSDSVLGSTVSSGTRSFTFGSGNTNTANDSWMYFSRGFPFSMVTNRFGIGTNAPASTLDVNGETTHRGAVTNLDLIASQFMATDANKREVSTLNGAGLTNITTTATNLFFPLILETNAGAVMFLDLPVSSAATAGTEQSYTFNVAGTAMLKLQRNHSSAGATTNAVIKTMGGFATNSITDFVIGTRYTNTSQRAWVSASAQLTAAVAGTAIVTLYCEQFQSITNKVTVSAGPLASLITVEPLTMITSPQAVFYFLDEKTGAGASVGIVAGTCSRIEL